MKEDGDADPFPRPSPSSAPTVTVEELEKKIAIDVKPKIQAAKIEAPKIGPPPQLDAQKAAAAIKGAIQGAMKQAQAQRATVREKKKGGWGWIWILIVLYFVFKTFLR